MKTRIEVSIERGEKMYSPQARINNNEPYKYISENPIGVFTLNDSSTKFNWINGAERVIDRYLFQKNQKASKNNKYDYVKYP